MQVKTYVKSSEIQGVGLFAAEDIPKGTIVWKFDTMDQVYTADEVEKMSDLHKEFFFTYCFMYNGKYIFCVDNARFFNHSEDPNCMSEGNSNEKLGYTVAKRDIKKDEELTDNYNEFGFIETDQIFNNII